MPLRSFGTLRSVVTAWARIAARAGITSEAPPYRPDVVDLIGPEWDHDSPTPAKQTLIICAAQRTGSYELCRFLTAAGLGVPHEYFHPTYAGRLMKRWGLIENPLSDVGLGSYIELLRRRRSPGGIFSTKLQYWQFEAALRNRHGATLFEGACVLHLFRPDIAGQLASFQAALQTGQWDFSARLTSIPFSVEDDSRIQSVLSQIEMLVAEDAGFRRLFALLGIRPLFLTMEELFSDPYRVIESIARRLGVAINRGALKRMIRSSSPYSRLSCSIDGPINGLGESLKRHAFPDQFSCWKLDEFNYDGQILSFARGGNGTNCLLSGWSKAEDWGVWSDGPIATVLLTDVALAGKGEVKLVIEARGFVNPSQPKQRVRVGVNGADAGELLLGGDITSTSLPVPTEALKSSFLRIELVPENSRSSALIGAPSDKCLLRVGLKSLSLKTLFFADE